MPSAYAYVLGLAKPCLCCHYLYYPRYITIYTPASLIRNSQVCICEQQFCVLAIKSHQGGSTHWCRTARGQGCGKRAHICKVQKSIINPVNTTQDNWHFQLQQIPKAIRTPTSNVHLNTKLSDHICSYQFYEQFGTSEWITQFMHFRSYFALTLLNSLNVLHQSAHLGKLRA